MLSAEEKQNQAALNVGVLTASLTDTSGWAHYSLSLMQALVRAGIQITVIAPRNSPPLDGVIVLPLLPTVEPLQGGLLIGQMIAFPQARAALRDCTVIHAAIESYAPLAALIAGSRPLIVTGHGSYVLSAERRRFPVNRIYGWAYRKSQMVCVSHYTARAVEGALPGIRTTVINNGVDFERFADIQHVGGGGVLSVGGVKARKGTLELVQAMAHIPDARCTIVGSLTSEPNYTARVQAEIERLGLHKRVTLTGRIADADLMRLYTEADVFALPSLNVGWKFEGYGLATLEASAAGLPVIGTRDNGAEDAVLDGVTGFSIPQTDLEHGLADAINRLLQDRSLAETMGAAGRDHARTQTWDHVAAQMIALYKAAISG